MSSDRRALIKAKAEERAAAKAERAALGAKLAQAADAADAADRSACVAVLDRIQRRAVEQRARRKLETRADRRRASLLRKNPHTERDASIKIGRRLVTDPTTLGKFIEVQVNRQLDVLTMEHSARPQRISDVEFAVGRLLQDAWTGRKDGDRRMDSFAKLGVLVSSGGDDGPLPSREMGMLRETFRARAVADLNLKIEKVVGGVGLRLLRAILVEGHTFGTYAACTVGGGERGAARIGERFRWLLNEVADHLHTATGAGGQHIRATREPA
ncbi:hypothetical protein [Methylorubrum extorquens]|uniref:Uncharacterized protein n=1 Tax=Methylorubrum extorquens TaxID=408 RepID=A0AAX3WLV8_METEX|nr:hypothetical protein [Methylorubrum extorquens]WHQ72540.1 hypothetical protein KEC54_13795 [Methylorubrum extorquens]